MREPDARGRQHRPTRYLSGGRLASVACFEHGRRHGPIRYYDEAGRAMRVEGWANDQLDGEAQDLGPDGRLVRSSCYAAASCMVRCASTARMARSRAR